MSKVSMVIGGVAIAAALVLVGCQSLVDTQRIDLGTDSAPSPAPSSTETPTTKDSAPDGSPARDGNESSADAMSSDQSSAAGDSSSDDPSSDDSSQTWPGPPPLDSYPSSVLGEIDSSSSVTVHPVVQCGSDAPGNEPEPRLAEEIIRLYPDREWVCLLGPAYLTGSGMRNAEATILSDYERYEVNFELTPDAARAFNQLAAMCYADEPTCPAGQIAIVFNGDVVSAATVNEPVFDSEVQLEGLGTEDDASELVDAINAE